MRRLTDDDDDDNPLAPNDVSFEDVLPKEHACRGKTCIFIAGELHGACLRQAGTDDTEKLSRETPDVPATAGSLMSKIIKTLGRGVAFKTRGDRVESPDNDARCSLKKRVIPDENSTSSA